MEEGRKNVQHEGLKLWVSDFAKKREGDKSKTMATPRSLERQEMESLMEGASTGITAWMIP